MSVQVGGFLQVLWFPSNSKTYRHDITEIVLKVALNTKTLTLTMSVPDEGYYRNALNLISTFFCQVQNIL